MKSVTIWLSDPDAHKYPFPHQIGERLTSQMNGIEGVVKNAKFAGPEGGGPFSMTYHIQTDSGDTIEIPLGELEKVKEDQKS